MGAPEYKYTDRDVRENANLREIAENYLIEYGGDFEPLVKAVQLLATEGNLPTSMVRVVLNCMRHDANVVNDLPAPIGYKLPKKVVSIKGRRHDYHTDCDNKESHHSHSYRLDDEILLCKGVPFEINRESYWMDAKVKRPFMRARGGRLVHFTTGEGWVHWLPKPHEWGFAKYAVAYLAAKAMCRYPSIINKPILMTEQQAAALLTNLPEEFSICPHCKEIVDAANCQEGTLSCQGEEREDSQSGTLRNDADQGSDLPQSE